MDSWEQRKLGNIVDFLDGQRKPLKESDRIKGKYPYYGASGIIDYINDYLFDENLVLLSEDGANIIDRNYPICFIATGKYWVNNHAHVLKVKAGVIDKFICESLERLDYTKFNTGTAQPKLNQDICQKIVITIPNEDEQKCISEFLDRINNIITLHQRKLDNLKLKKKTLLQKLFPKNGERYPELRFPGFTDAWEQRKLSDVLVERNEQQVETREYPLMSFVQGLGVTPKGERYDRSFLVLDQSKKYKRTELGDFIYSSNNLETGSIGINKTGKAVISPVYSIFQGVSIGDSQFIGIMSLLPRFIAKMIRFRQGVVYGQWRIHETDFLDISVLIPSVDERTKITQLILSIEELITLHQRKLDHLQLQKKALLQQMFV